MAQSEAEKDKNDVAIQGDLNFNVVEPTTARTGVTKTIDIRSTAPLSKINLKSAKLSAEIGSSRRRIVSPWVISSDYLRLPIVCLDSL